MAEEGATDLLHDWSNNNLDLGSKKDKKKILENGNCLEDKEETALDSARNMTLDRKDQDRQEPAPPPEPSVSFLDDLGADSDQESHTSSLESAPDSGEKNGNLNRDGCYSEEELGSSTSCSVDSFEITSPFQTLSLDRRKGKPQTEEETPKVESKGEEHFTDFQSQANPKEEASSSRDMTEMTGSCTTGKFETTQETSTSSRQVEERSTSEEHSQGSEKAKVSESLDAAKKSIHEELSQLDTGMPDLDFSKLEEQLNTAAKEREMDHRKLMFEEVRKKLAMDPEESTSAYPPVPATRPARSNLAKRLQSGKSLQVCYMNDTVLSSEDDDEEETSESCSEDTEEDFGDYLVPKSKSAPNLSGRNKGVGGVGRSVSSVADSSKKASELRRAAAEREAEEISGPGGRQAKLEEETRLMLAKAKQTAKMQMEVERQSKSSKSFIEEIVGIPLSKRRLTRPQLMKMGITQLQIIVNDLHTKIESLNEELVHYLVERDNLHMEQDSMLVDVEDLLRHQKSENLPGFLVQTPHESKPSKFRIFKR